MLPQTAHPFKDPISLLCLSDVFSHFYNFVYHLEKYNVALASDINEFVMANLELSG